MIKLSDIKISVFSPQDVLGAAAKKMGKRRNELNNFRILKKSLDARKKNDIHYLYSCEFALDDEKIVEEKPKLCTKQGSVLVVGSGPCGLFCALTLARRGLKVTVIERGQRVDMRKKSVESFIESRRLNIESNVQFGEGGAGAFSDGKLNTGTGSDLIKLVLGDFVHFGAPPEIEYDAKPHIGSDRLPDTVAAIRGEIIALGGKVLFGTKLQSLKIENNRVTECRFDGAEQYDEIVLAIGHSARDTFQALYDSGVAFEQKAFAVGYRIEHLQEWLNIRQYGDKAAKVCPPADYKLVSHASSRSCFTFCMCPGGYVLPASSEEGMLAVNGMSNYARDGLNCNSAVIAEVKTDDFGSSHPLSGVEFQRKIERAAFSALGDYAAPIELLGDFLGTFSGRTPKAVKPTYPLSYGVYRLDSLLPKPISDAIKCGISDMDKRLNGFAFPEAVLTAVESRTSSPVRIPRTPALCSVSADNLYPAGEGCGYAGGIMSAAVDGVRVALAIAEKYGCESAQSPN